MTLIPASDRLKNQGNFTRIPNEILDHVELSNDAKILWQHLYKRCFNGGNASYPGMETLSEEMGKSERTVRKYMNELKDMNMIEVEQRGVGQTNLYYIYCPRLDDSGWKQTSDGEPDRKQASALTGSELPTGPEANGHPQYNKTKGEENEERNNGSADPSFSSNGTTWKEKFDKWWNVYLEEFKDIYEPRKKTQKRKRKFKRRLETYDVDEIIEATRKIAKSDFHCGANDRNKVYAKPEFILRNDEKIEEWLNYEGEPDDGELSPEMKRLREKARKANPEYDG